MERGNLLNLLFACLWIIPLIEAVSESETHLGDGLKYATTYMPDDCTHSAQVNDVIHYHYVGRLGDTGKVFGRSFDYNSPYIVALGQGRIIAGMDRGLVGTCLWERRKITFPPELGYGDRGVGQMIPPNATLVFYIRMIKIERNGRALGANPTLKELWDEALQEYTAENWNRTVEVIEEALEQFDLYQKQTMTCLSKCKDTIAELVEDEESIVNMFSEKDPMLKQYLNFAAKAKCINQCKKESLPRHIRNSDPLVLEKFNNRVPYAYLQFSYYKLENFEEGLKCAYPYFFYNPNDTMIINSIQFYKKQLNLDTDDFPSREPGMKSHHLKYQESKEAYGEQKWSEAVKLMEEAVNEYMTTVNECRLMCEDIVYVNFTDSKMSISKFEFLEEAKLSPDSMEYYQLLKAIAHKFLTCRTNCDVQMATIEGKYYPKYLPGHFNHLQYAYYKLDEVNKSAEAASTFRVLEPSDVIMANNVKFYRGNMNTPFESFKARDDVVELKRHIETEERILSFIDTGVPKKRIGSRGDDGDQLVRDEL